MKKNMHLFRVFACITSLILGAVSVSASTGYVSTEELNVRSEPSTDAEVVDKLHAGDEVMITYGPEDGWMEIYYGGECCYVCSDFISSDASAAQVHTDEEEYEESGNEEAEYEDWDDETGEEQEFSGDDLEEKSSSSENLQYLGEFTLTGYCNCAQCCGTAGNQTASGTWPTQGVTVAMGGVDFGTQLMINGTVYTVEDRGTPYGHVDIYFDNHSDALAFGMQSADVYLVA